MTTIVFPGQGSQHIGMAKEFYDNFKSAKDVFELIEDSTKIRVKDIIFENTDNLLSITKYTQICIFTASMAIFEVFKEMLDNKSLSHIDFVLGHSLGEYSALTASKAITISDCAKLLKTRGELMQNASPANISGMAAVVGLNCRTVEQIIKKNLINVEIANDNTSEQVVISGLLNNIKKFEEILISHGVRKIIYLNVSAAFHSKIMKQAEEKLKNSIFEINFSNPFCYIVDNFSATANKEKLNIISNLSQQMSNKVKWLDSIKLLESKKEKNIIEIGPGKVLTGIIRRISKRFNLFNINKINDIEILMNEI